MIIEPAVGSLRPDAFSQRVTTVCPGMPALTVYRHEQVDLSILTTSTVIVEFVLADDGKRLVRRHRRVVVGLS